jgi:hypothetical protein
MVIDSEVFLRILLKLIAMQAAETPVVFRQANAAHCAHRLKKSTHHREHREVHKKTNTYISMPTQLTG